MLDEDSDARTIVEINVLDEPSGQCAWKEGCAALATHNVVQYDSLTAETLVDGTDANYCEPHARAMKARLEEWE